MSPTSRATWLNPTSLARVAMPPFYPPGLYRDRTDSAIASRPSMSSGSSHCSITRSTPTSSRGPSCSATSGPVPTRMPEARSLSADCPASLRSTSAALRPETARVISVRRRQGKRPPGPVAADDDGRAAGARGPDLQRGVAQPVELALERDGLLVAEQPGDYLEPLLEAREAAACVQQLEAEHLVLALLPARADAELETAAGQVVYSRRLPGRDDRVAERERRDERPELYAARVLREPGQGGPQLQGVEGGAARAREVLRAVQPGVAGVLDRPPE